MWGRRLRAAPTSDLCGAARQGSSARAAHTAPLDVAIGLANIVAFTASTARPIAPSPRRRRADSHRNTNGDESLAQGSRRGQAQFLGKLRLSPASTLAIVDAGRLSHDAAAIPQRLRRL